MSDILLVMPPYSDIYGKIKIDKMGFILPSLGLAYIASFLKSKGKNVELIDAACIDNIELLLKKIKIERPRIVGLNVVTANMSVVADMAVEIKKVSPLTKIVVGGAHPSALPAETMEYEGIDVVVIGEGEFTMLDLCDSKDLASIRGICYKDEHGRVKINEPRALIKDLDSLPFPLLEQLPTHRYGYLSLGNALPVLSGRGCPYECSFCASGVINRRSSRFRSSTNFVDELQYLVESSKIKKFVFCDEAFTLNQNRTIEICEEILKRGLKIRWSCMMRVDNASEKVLKIMKRAGCQMIEVGVESADEVVLKKCGKRINLEQVVETVRLASQIKLEVNAFFILGLPYDSRESIMKTISFSKKLKLDYAQFSMFIPLPGSTAWEIVQKGDILRCIAKDWSDFSRYKKPIVTSDTLSNEMLYLLYNKAVKNFYFRPYMLWVILKKINSFERLNNFWKSALCLLNILKDRSN